MRTSPVLCARSREGWCATKAKKVQESTFNVKTVCDMVIVLPWGLQKRVPSCQVCRLRVRAKQGC